MQLLAIRLINWGVLILVLVGVPAITSLRLGGLRLGADEVTRQLTLWGLGLAALANLLAMYYFSRRSKQGKLCLTWSIIHAALWGVEYLFFLGVIRFGWLKEFLLWLKQQSGL